jgi:hypothetical protein
VQSILISLHLPKTAGESFAKTLQDFYKENLVKDYADYPVNTVMDVRNRIALQYAFDNTCQNSMSASNCIHGHFLPLKYLHHNHLTLKKNNNVFITWMRHPVDRMISHYYYWIERSTLKAHAPLHQRIVEEKWSLEKFCLSSELQNLYEQFLWGFPLRYFDFIGITEHYQSDLHYFSSKYLDGSSQVYDENRRPMVKNAHKISDALREEIEVFHANDMELYRRACEKRHLRLK